MASAIVRYTDSLAVKQRRADGQEIVIAVKFGIQLAMSSSLMT